MKNALLILIVIPVLGFSQKINKKDVPTISLDSIVYDLTPKTLAPSSIFLPFKQIEVLDARFDTSKLGYEYHRQYDKINNLKYKGFKKIKLSKDIQESLQSFYNDYYSLCLKDSANKLLIVLKKLWIDNAPRNDTMFNVFNKVASRSYQDIHIKWEYYLQKNNKYFPYKRVDTIYQLTEDVLSSRDFKFKKNDLSFFIFVLKAQLEQFNFEGIEEKFTNSRSLTFYSIDSFNKKRFLLPVITSSNIKKGVFQTFNQFRNNTPGIEDYELKKIKKDKRWINKNNSEVIDKFFLMSDSIGIHIGSTDRMSVMRVGNTFEYFELCTMGVSKTVLGSFLSVGSGVTDRYDNNDYIYDRSGSGNGSKLLWILVPRQIDMETGEVY